MLIEKADRCKGTIGLHNEDVSRVQACYFNATIIMITQKAWHKAI
ncbi:MAG: hypothetical protein ACLVD1_09030 [Lacrimispora saccharolytica]